MLGLSELVNKFRMDELQLMVPDTGPAEEQQAPVNADCECSPWRVCVCVCGTPVCQGFNDSFVYLYAGGAGSSDTARANEALCRETYLQVSSWVLEAQLDWP